MSLVLTLASRNLFHDWIRFAATLVGIVFSVVLVMIQMGLYFGFGRMVTTMIDHASADLWIVSRGAKSFEDLSLLDAALRDRVGAVPGVAAVGPVVIGFAGWRLPSGSMTPVFVVGSEPQAGALQPWNVVDGTADALTKPGEVAVDRTYEDRLGVAGLGAHAEISGHPVTIGAVTDGIRSFTTTPYVFAALDRARSYIGLPGDKVSNMTVRLRPGADLGTARRDIESIGADVEVLTTAEFRARSRSFWLFGTGAGAALFAGALLGVIVGMVIVAQTLYSSTKEHLGEFATMRAIGCSKSYVYRIIIWQALINAIIGFALAATVGATVVELTAATALPIVLTRNLMIGVFILTVVMCVGAALAAIMRVVRLDPVMVMAR